MFCYFPFLQWGLRGAFYFWKKPGMKAAKILLRVAAGLMLFHAAAHSIGHSGWKKPKDPLAREVIEKMTGTEFPFMGRIHSMGDYYDGYGYATTLGMLLFVGVLWVVAGEAGSGRGME